MSYLPGLLRLPVSKTARSHSTTIQPLVAVNRESETRLALTGYSRIRRAAQILRDSFQTVSPALLTATVLSLTTRMMLPARGQVAQPLEVHHLPKPRSHQVRGRLMGPLAVLRRNTTRPGVDLVPGTTKRGSQQRCQVGSPPITPTHRHNTFSSWTGSSRCKFGCVGQRKSALATCLAIVTAASPVEGVIVSAFP